MASIVPPAIRIRPMVIRIILLNIVLVPLFHCLYIYGKAYIDIIKKKMTVSLKNLQRLARLAGDKIRGYDRGREASHLCGIISPHARVNLDSVNLA